MRSNPHSPGFWHLVPLYLACYVVWIALSALGLWIILQLRINLIDLAVLLRINPWALGAVDKFSLLILGVIWLICVILLEHYLRRGIPQNALWTRATRVLLAELLLLGASYGLQRLVLIL